MEIALLVLFLAALAGAGFLFLQVRTAKTAKRHAEKEAEEARTAEAQARQGEAEARAAEREAQINAAVGGERVRQLESQLQEEQNRTAEAERRRDAALAAKTEALEKAAALEAEHRKLPDEFKNLAQTVLEEKSGAFDARARKELEPLIGPLSEAIGSFRKKAEEIDTRRVEEHATLRANIAALQEGAVRIADDANNLTRALKGDKKALGDWGETTLERLLEESGLQRGTEYEAQPVTPDEDGRPQRPDFKILLPEGRHLIVDSKASLVAYHAHVSAQTEDGRARALTEHVIAVRNHAKALGDKHYQRGRGVNSPDFVLMFMPMESAWMAALQAADRLFDDSYDRKVVIVSRTTLLPTLKTVAQLWKLERQNKSVREIAGLAGRMHDKFADFLENLAKIGRALDAARTAHRDAVQKLEGHNNLMRQAGRLADMGADAKKKLPRLTAGDEE